MQWVLNIQKVWTVKKFWVYFYGLCLSEINRFSNRYIPASFSTYLVILWLTTRSFELRISKDIFHLIADSTIQIPFEWNKTEVGNVFVLLTWPTLATSFKFNQISTPIVIVWWKWRFVSQLANLNVTFCESRT